MKHTTTAAVGLFFVAMIPIAIAVDTAPVSASPPNIVFILADDMGYGEVSAMNPDRCKVPTPAIDRLAAQGMLMTDAHSSSSVCTPTRYSILTGRYNWRTKLQRFVLYGYSPPLIDSNRLTVAGFLKEQGYNTAAIGKWHLGMDLPTTDGKAPGKGHSPKNIDWKGTIKNGPTSRGFDYFYGISASLDMPPFIYIENDRFVGQATATKKYQREGPAEPDFEAVDVLPVLKQKAVNYIKRQTTGRPYFAYIALNSPHTPILPSREWQGKSAVGRYGDFVMQTDDVVGAIVDAIDQSASAENTIVIFTTDNGCSKMAKIEQLKEAGHYVSGPLRGSKGDLWEGGHRVPFILRWPAKVAAGTRSDETIGQWDLMATCADLLQTELPPRTAEDSVSFLPALQGQPIQSTRRGIVHHAIDGHFAYRAGDWKLLLARGSGGLTAPREKNVSADAPQVQLYNLATDIGETNNLYRSEPDIVNRLLGLLESDVRRGRSSEGVDAKNDVESIQLWKSKN
ncbi:arylsulfatase A [Rhodopirellula maiorica SM1]|uniref:Arylsulfatase A n=1 Tax=Rhodopirellula maiorica SM1 TaxID=1265738 RepID=M5RU19_9BACT|nr:arylsulfatase [Rhodopirellula maiorica]EMI17474.1 arylsulfatase A [Rhodopirellula maiorica SM1]